MKKIITTITVMVIATLMLSMMSFTAMAAGFDFDTAISEFSSTSLNTTTLKLNETHTPTAAVWTHNNLATCYSSDESVVTVSSRGVVTAVGEGTAYVAYDVGSMYELYRYDVITVQNIENDAIGATDQSDILDVFENFNAEAIESIEEYEDFDDFAEGQFKNIPEFITESDHFNKVQNRENGIFVFAIVLAITLLILVICEIIYIYIEAPKCGMSRLWALVPLFSNLIGLIVFIVVRSNRKNTVSTNNIMCPTCNSVHHAGTIECSICGTKLQ